jgi:uncharacterized protein (TIGR02246 family)
MEKAMHKKLILATMLIASLGVVSVRSQESVEGSVDEHPIRQSLEDYARAFNNGDMDTVMSFWDGDADYVDADGSTHRGKEAIGELFRNAAQNLQGHKISLKIDTLKLVKPEVAIEDGTASITGPDGESRNSRYTAVWVKSGDKWLIESARELPDDDDAAAAENDVNHLQPLEWLIGEWASEDSGPGVKFTARWALDGKFLLQEYTVAGDADADFRVAQWIGFDPVTGQIKSWTFDSRGGYGEGLWSRDGNTWHGETTGVLPDGRIGTASNSVRFVDDTHLEWRSTGRNVEGQPMPDSEVRFVRSNSTKEASAP